MNSWTILQDVTNNVKGTSDEIVRHFTKFNSIVNDLREETDKLKTKNYEKNK